MTGRSLLPILESERSGRIEPQRDFIVTGLDWHGEFDPASRSCRSIRDDRYAYVVKYANVDKQGEPLDKPAPQMAMLHFLNRYFRMTADMMMWTDEQHRERRAHRPTDNSTMTHHRCLPPSRG